MKIKDIIKDQYGILYSSELLLSIILLIFIIGVIANLSDGLNERMISEEEFSSLEKSEPHDFAPSFERSKRDEPLRSFEQLFPNGASLLSPLKLERLDEKSPSSLKFPRAVNSTSEKSWFLLGALLLPVFLLLRSKLLSLPQA